MHHVIEILLFIYFFLCVFVVNRQQTLCRDTYKVPILIENEKHRDEPKKNHFNGIFLPFSEEAKKMNVIHFESICCCWLRYIQFICSFYFSILIRKLKLANLCKCFWLHRISAKKSHLFATIPNMYIFAVEFFPFSLMCLMAGWLAFVIHTTIPNSSEYQFCFHICVLFVYKHVMLYIRALCVCHKS